MESIKTDIQYYHNISNLSKNKITLISYLEGRPGEDLSLERYQCCPKNSIKEVVIYIFLKCYGSHNLKWSLGDIKSFRFC